MATAEIRPPSAVSQLLDSSAYPNFNFTFSPFLQREYSYPKPIKEYRPSSSLICKHWLRGLCKKGAHCEFLHEYNLRRMPECSQYNRYLACPNGSDCLFLHIDPKPPACPHYERGFCPLGPSCANTHVKSRHKTLCRYYLAGFCPNGRDCDEGAHPLWKETDDMPKPQIRIILSDEEKERRRLEMVAKMEKEKEEEERAFQERMGQGGGQLQQGKGQGQQQNRGRGRRNWQKQKRERF